MASVSTGSDTELMGSVTGTIIDGRLYVIGGSLSSYDHVGAVLEFSLNKFDAPLRWSDVPTPRGNMTSAAIGDDIFVVAGLQALKSGDKVENFPSCHVDCFNVKTKTWKKCAPLPEQRVKPGLAVVGDKLYAFSGRVDEIDANSIFVYEPTVDRWTLLSNDLPFASRHGAACSVGEDIYFCGGHTCRRGGGHFQTSIVKYSTRTAEIATLAELPEARAAHALLAVDDYLYLLGGLDWNKNSVATVFRYSLANDCWETCRPLNSPRAVFAAAVDGRSIFLAGGWKRMGKESNPTLEQYEV